MEYFYKIYTSIKIHYLSIELYYYQKRLFVIKPLGEDVEIANDDNFKPVTW